MIEQWETVEDFEDYEVSNKGKVRKRHGKMMIKEHLHKGKNGRWFKNNRRT